MPTYEYTCKDCGNRLEVVQSFSEPALTTCDACGGTLRKVFSAAGIIFKGSGYYVTDSRKADTSDAAAVTTSDTAKGDAKLTDAKPKAESSTATSSSASND